MNHSSSTSARRALRSRFPADPHIRVRCSETKRRRQQLLAPRPVSRFPWPLATGWASVGLFVIAGVYLVVVPILENFIPILDSFSVSG